MKFSNKLLAVTAAALMTFSITSCGGEKTNSGLKDAADYLFQLYKEDSGATTANFERVSIVSIDSVVYNVAWSVEIAEGGLGVVSVGETNDETKMTTINVEFKYGVATKDTEYTLNASVTDGKDTIVKSFTGFKVPEFKVVTIKEWMDTADTKSPLAMKGIVTAVNKTKTAGSFTFTDETATVFSYDSPSMQVSVGDELIISSVYSHYNGLPQLKAPTVIEKLNTNKLSEVEKHLEVITAATIAENLASYAQDPKLISTKFLKITGAYAIADGDYTAASATKDGSKLFALYYHSSSDIKPLIGKAVDIYGVVRGVGSSSLTIQVTFMVEAGATVTF